MSGTSQDRNTASGIARPTSTGRKLSNWRPPRKVSARVAEPANVTTLEDARAKITCKVTEHLRRGEPGLLIVTGVPGVGKTKCTMDACMQVAEETGSKIAWFGTRHDQFDTVSRPSDWLHTMGRNPDNCLYSKKAQTLAAKGWSAAKLLCGGSCSKAIRRCDWWRQWFYDKHRYMPSEHLCIAGLWDCSGLRIVFDELDAGDFAPEPVWVSSEALHRGAKAWPGLQPVLDELSEFLSGFEEEGWRADGRLYRSLPPVVDHIPDDLEAYPQGAGKAGNPQLPDARIIPLLKCLRDELRRHCQGEAFVSRVGFYGGGFVHYPALNLPERVFKHPAVLLNSTASVDELRHLLESPDYPVDVYSPSVGLHPESKVKYVLDANHSKTTVKRRNDGYRARWHRRVRAAVEGSNSALVIATKDGEERLQEALADLVGERVHLAHYGAVSGLNKYEESDTVVLSQPFNPPVVAVAERYRRFYGGLPGKPLQLETCFHPIQLHTRDGVAETYEVAVRSMRDERLAPLYEHWRWSEMYQAAHRVRPVLHKRRVVVTCAIPLEGLPATTASYSPPGRKKAKTLLQDAACRLLEDKGFFTRRDLTEKSGLHKSTISRHWDRLIQEMELTVNKEDVPSPRYPGGRLTEVARRG